MGTSGRWTGRFLPLKKRAVPGETAWLLRAETLLKEVPMSRILASAVVLVAGSLFSIGALSVEASAASSTASVTSGVLTFTAAGGQQNAIGITPGDAPDSWLLSDSRPGNDITPE